mgnify:CR=1 FL=1|jgi:hypothetical protein
MRRSALPLFLLTLGLFVACSNDPDDAGNLAEGNTSSGSVAGHTLVPASALSTPLEGGTAWVIISSQADVCADRKGQTTRPNIDILTFQLGRAVDNEIAPLTPGEYDAAAVPGPGEVRAVEAEFNHVDDDCKATRPNDEEEATSGSVTLTKVDLSDGGLIEGTFDLVFPPNGERLTGTFRAPVCNYEQPSVGEDWTCAP